ncbi:hypothetical protein PAXRUDRAFT_829485 [Paxillus rubicundulus Ve08.2h10]|uniref:Unplaced genomic scaffold scaffold_405, whole genome shotgun sequence n=1 Tax=Paxillus rubicundulus Ve08.2h10 TaxID=930991 RepID=A0A0D0D7V4_9AGAM|nr:hypothetical protein PAXRUDRAFT_829485 [Paxillus rubicundulus Ve08.2h10]
MLHQYKAKAAMPRETNRTLTVGGWLLQTDGSSPYRLFVRQSSDSRVVLEEVCLAL